MCTKPQQYSARRLLEFNKERRSRQVWISHTGTRERVLV
jgi:hypothetical protein